MLEQLIKTDDILSDQDIKFFKLDMVGYFAEGFIYKGQNNVSYLLDPIKNHKDLYKVWFQYKN